ncbi:Lft1p SKDI_13G1000 [Saccharomyces kudriavzevii IFO 1802]|uniref:YML037C-like protein n=2 Tax=Saccharomyces kudriavzevii (strain ATCC MYA-4449 / AS 2.2408 / CBS 8840 / NBRC 1802 / NCYC 2889) TaxID=226230 RepID=J4U416_SACK1|nr:uncharacterized protein SKDI_13G1000 [Saccharomyces kudriavzevii IFO 1802]EJT44645.1 YML037C-like protein [Saccharomyces kudriavzevii IFO 1802]CAI4047759.1 hypothetical protein SKDI_13G1000 [Saccharomyces kudriavzevii IFO 1802]
MDENKLIDQLLGKEYEPQDDPDEVKNEDVSLYGLLDEVANGRRLMNCLFHSSMQEGKKVGTDKLARKCRQILRVWTDEEKTITMNSGVLQLDGPVLFSWSHNSAPISTQKTANAALPKDSMHKENDKANVTTTRQLFDIASAEIDKCIAPNSKSWMGGKCFGENEPSGTESNKHSSAWANSDFKVDPLQKFIVKELPKTKKKPDDDQAKKTKSKRKSFFGFWSHSGTKSSSKKKSEKSMEAKAEIHEEAENTSRPPKEDNTLNDGNTTQSNQESTNNQQVKPTESEPPAVDDGCRDYDEFGGFEQASLHASDLLSSEPSIASIHSLKLGSFVPLQPKKKT